MSSDNENLFDVFHKFNKLVRRGIEDPILCGRDNSTYYTAINDDDELVLICSTCGGELKPGGFTLTRVRDAVKRYF